MPVRICWRKVIVAVAAMGFALSTTTAQTVEEGKRKTKATVTPAYPELAHRLNISGKVRIEVVVREDGHVKSARAIGGHPLLVQASIDAVKQWEYEPSPKETIQIAEFNFHE